MVASRCQPSAAPLSKFGKLNLRPKGGTIKSTRWQPPRVIDDFINSFEPENPIEALRGVGVIVVILVDKET